MEKILLVYDQIKTKHHCHLLILVEFVVEKVGEHLSAKDMVSELEPVLDNEAEPFVIKLWRMLIYETLKANEKA